MPAIPEMIAGMARSYGRNDDQAPKLIRRVTGRQEKPVGFQVLADFRFPPAERSAGGVH